MAFEPKDHLIDLNSNPKKPRWYLETKWRLVWFRDVYPQGKVNTEVLQVLPPLVKASVLDNDGCVIATGHGTAQAKSANVTWAGREIEKAETAAIGRALGHAGFGTQFSDEDETDNLADSPASAPNVAKAQQPPPSAKNAPSPVSAPQNGIPDDGAPDPLDWTKDTDGQLSVEDAMHPATIGSLDMKKLYDRCGKAGLVQVRRHFDNLIRLMKADGSLRDAMSADQAFEAIRQHYAAKVTA